MASLRTLRKRTRPPDPWDHIDWAKEIAAQRQDWLFDGCRTRRMGTVKTQLDNGADVNQIRRSATGEIDTPLLAAITNNRSRIAILLLKRGADPKVADGQALSPLHHAAVLGLVAVVKALITPGADVNARTAQGETPLAGANIGILLHHSHKRCDRGIQIVMENGANPNKPDGRGHSPLHVAVENGEYGLVRRLVKMEADLKARNDKGHTPLEALRKLEYFRRKHCRLMERHKWA